MKKYFLALIIVNFSIISVIGQSIKLTNTKSMTTIETATVANGCFWCTEAIFQLLNGVESVTSGYTGGTLKNPTYNEVITGRTGHAEAIQIKFDTSKISFIEILEVFFSTHDPTTLNKQGYDVGTQYRSAIFYNSETQKKEAEEFIKVLSEAKVFENPIVTEVTKLDVFYIAENYHQNYYNNNKTQGYCVAVINPKLEKFLKQFKSIIKK
ncbi:MULTISPECIES: peptide-methionine (S)-S-oxide reductase MsrA [Flavobacteriaceae]|uniref:Peptide methionine sulfoxide reductase MsrA n=2 Tax=Flavobacteriaceae TaxID=49546 RepID=A0A4Y8AVV3_9FLAO|nr:MULTISPECIES: peptide-methionine (S)-S-oxide reductase MsrA [Flavobacteriaceae]TEW76676.1 peptide-methionine (S)-S-oxide reductase MsrA [Gramella jeungdoensis]GGK50940.1 peptide methionine sulfoxide reductase MsrA [Lutibacter litoralis]